MADLPPLPNNLPTASAPIHPAIQAALDAEHLRLLEIGFYISGVVTAFRFIWFIFIAGFFALAGFSTTMIPHHATPSNNAPPALVFFVMAGVFGTIILLSLVFAGLEIYAGICLRKRKHPVLIQVVAAFYCLSIPWGTALGVFTFMVLNRPSVRPLFTGIGSAP